MISVIVPVYNEEKHVERCIQSVLMQTYDDFELLLVDDGSKDASGEICDKYADKEPRIRVFHIENGGVSRARNYGIAQSSGEWLMFLDSDDVLYPDAVEKMYVKIKSDEDLMAVGCYLEYIDGRGKKLGGGLFLGETTKEEFYKKAEKARP